MIKEMRVTGRCPFLESDEEGHGHTCVSHPGSPEPITPRHVDSFCRKERPLACPRFVGADPGLLRAYLRQLASSRTANAKNDTDGEEAVAPSTSSQHAPHTGAGRAPLSRPQVAPTAPHRQIAPSRLPAPQPTSGHELVDDADRAGNDRIPEATPLAVDDQVETEQAGAGDVREASIQGAAAADTLPLAESEVKPIAATTRTESPVRTDREAVPSISAGEPATVASLQGQPEPSLEISLEAVHEVVPAEPVSSDAQPPAVQPVREFPSITYIPLPHVVVTTLPPPTSAPATIYARTISVDKPTAVPRPDPFEPKSPADVKTDELISENSPADRSTIGEVVRDWPQDRDRATMPEVPINKPSAMSGHAAALFSSAPIEAMARHEIPAFQNPPQATPRPQIHGRRRYIVGSAASVVLLVGIGLLLRQAASGLTPGSAPPHLKGLAPTTTWSFHPLKPSVDQIDFAFSNRGTTAVNVQLKAPAAKNKIVKSIRIAANSSEEIALDSRAAYGALVVHASGPVVVSRTSVHRESVKFTYGTPVRTHK